MDWTIKYLFLFVLLFGALPDSTTLAKEAKGCEIINMRQLAENVTATFDSSLKFSFTSDDNSWDISATISDANGTECQLILMRSGKHFENNIICENLSFHETQELKDKDDALFSDVWKDILIDTDVCNPNSESKLCKTRLKVVYTQLLVIDMYRPEWADTPLIPPLRIHWTKEALSDLVVNCDKKECVTNASLLFSPKRNMHQSFFLKPRNTSEGFMLSFDSSLEDHIYFNISDFEKYADRWVKVTIDRENTTFKVLVDGEVLMHLDNDNTFIEKFRIASVDMTGGGLLSWCNPNDQEWIYLLVFIAMTVTIVVLIFTLVCIGCKLRQRNQCLQTFRNVKSVNQRLKEPASCLPSIEPSASNLPFSDQESYYDDPQNPHQMQPPRSPNGPSGSHQMKPLRHSNSPSDSHQMKPSRSSSGISNLHFMQPLQPPHSSSNPHQKKSLIPPKQTLLDQDATYENPLHPHQMHPPRFLINLASSKQSPKAKPQEDQKGLYLEMSDLTQNKPLRPPITLTPFKQSSAIRSPLMNQEHIYDEPPA